jgi:hypothetical protein
MSKPAPASSSLQSASFAKTSPGALRCAAGLVAVGESSTRREKTSTMRLPKASTLDEVAAAAAAAAAVAEAVAAAAAAQGASEKATVLHRAALTALAPERMATATLCDASQVAEGMVVKEAAATAAAESVGEEAAAVAAVR